MMDQSAVQPQSRELPRSLCRSILILAVVFGGTNLSIAQGPGNPSAKFEWIDLSDEGLNQYGSFLRAAEDLEGLLSAIEFHKTAIVTVNFFGISVGGINAIQDLEDGRGVDPETLAGLYAGYAIPEVARHLNLRIELSPEPGADSSIVIDAPDGRLRYKGTVVRLYSPARMQKYIEQRARFREDDDRQRIRQFREFVNLRLREIGAADQQAIAERGVDLEERYRRFQEEVSRLENVLISETAISSVMPAADQHFFSYAVGGLDTRRLLTNFQTMDVGSFSAVYARRISTDLAEKFRLESAGVLTYEGNRVRVLSPADLRECFRRRERLQDLSQGRRIR